MILNLYPAHIVGTVVQVLVTVFNQRQADSQPDLWPNCAGQGIRTELYMEDKNLGKQFQYADKKAIPLVAILGPEEAASGVVKLKHLVDGIEVTVTYNEVARQDSGAAWLGRSKGSRANHCYGRWRILDGAG